MCVSLTTKLRQAKSSQLNGCGGFSFLRQIPDVVVLGKDAFFNVTAKRVDYVEAGIFYITEGICE